MVWLFFGMFIANLQRLVLVRGAAAWDLHSFFATVDSILGGAFMGTMGGCNLVHGIARICRVCLLFFRGKDFVLWAIILHRGVCGDTLQPITFVFRRSLRHVFAHAEWSTPDVNLVRGGCFCIGNLHVPRVHTGRCLACRCSSCLPMVGS